MKKSTDAIGSGRIKGNFLSSVVDIFELPAEIILNLPLLTVTGSSSLKIENYVSVTEYNCDTVKINTAVGLIKICGKDIKIKQITNEEIQLNGKITNIEYENRVM